MIVVCEIFGNGLTDIGKQQIAWTATKGFRKFLIQKAQADQSLEQFLLKYKLSGDTPENLIDYTDKNIHRREAVKHALVEAKNRLTTFLENNPGIEKAVADINEDLPNLDDLQMLEKRSRKKLMISMRN